MKVLGLLLVSSLSVFALDLSIDKSKDMDNGTSQSLSSSKDKSIDNTTKRENSTTKSKDKSVVKSKKIDLNGKIKAISYLAALELANVEPFGDCRLITKPRNVKDFDLSCVDDFGVNNNYCNYLKESASNYMYVKEIVENQEERIKSYANCGLLYGGIITQYLKNGDLDIEIKDQEILSTIQDFEQQLNESECNFAEKVDNIMCDSVSINYQRGLKLSVNEIEVFGGNEYLGYKLNLSKDKSMKSSLSTSYVRSKARSDSRKMAKSIKMDQSNNYKISKKAASNLSVGKFIKD